MTTLIVSTIRRKCPPTEPSGFIYTVDLESGKLLQRSYIVEPAYIEFDDNPRGGLRGGKGISVRDDQIAIANFSMINLYDPQWSFIGVITHPSCAAIHDILYQGDTLWVTAARTDMLMQFDLYGNLLRHYYMRDPSPVLDELGWKEPLLVESEHVENGKTDFRDPRTHLKETFDRAHVNSVCLLPGDAVLVSLGFIFGTGVAKLLRLKIWLIRMGLWSRFLSVNRQIRKVAGRREKNGDKTLVMRPGKAQSAVLQLSPKNGSRLVRLIIPNVTVPSHSLLSLHDGNIVYLNTSDGSVIHLEPYTGEVFSSTKITKGFLRGITLLDDQRVIIGSLGELILFDLGKQKVLTSIRITHDPTESIYDIKILPAHYANPPDSFEEHFTEATGFRNAAAMIESGARL